MLEKEVNIDCLKFKRHEQLMRNIKNRMNQSKDIQEKTKFAQELQAEAEELLSCQVYDTKSFDCPNCNFIAKLRKRTATLIIKVRKLV